VFLVEYKTKRRKKEENLTERSDFLEKKVEAKRDDLNPTA